eukprot:s70_g18.t1
MSWQTVRQQLGPTHGHRRNSAPDFTRLVSYKAPVLHDAETTLLIRVMLPAAKSDNLLQFKVKPGGALEAMQKGIQDAVQGLMTDCREPVDSGLPCVWAGGDGDYDCCDDADNNDGHADDDGVDGEGDDIGGGAGNVDGDAAAETDDDGDDDGETVMMMPPAPTTSARTSTATTATHDDDHNGNHDPRHQDRCHNQYSSETSTTYY